VAAGTGRRTFVAVLVAMLLVGTAGASVWLMASSGVLSFGGGQGLPGAPGPGATVPGGEAAALAAGGFRVSPPRDPFAPLITAPTSSTVPGETTTTVPGETTTTVPGETTTTGGGSTSTTSPDTPAGKRVMLLEIREEGGVRQAVLTVDGVTFTVAVGETFADDFKVISLGASSGVFMYRDSVFTLAVGQSIIK
jgi:hypothetical protein